MYRNFKRGKVLVFSLSAGLWQNDYLGHAEGLDGVLFRSIVWTSMKPFILRAMPPFVTVRIDDVSGSGSPVAKFKQTVEELTFVDILNKYGFIPNLGLFIDDIGDRDTRKIKEKYYDRTAEFSPHAFTDPENKNEFPIYMKHNGKEFSERELKENFNKTDYKFNAWGIKPSLTVNAHFGDIGVNALPFLKTRGQRFLMNPKKVGKVWNDPQADIWEVGPYGKPNFSLSPIPEDKDFFNVVSHPGDFSAGSDQTVNFDFLCGCTTFWKENAKNDVQKAIKRGAEQIKKGIENRFFGCLMTHEQRISYLKPDEWDKIIAGISKTVKDCGISKGYDYISQYAENRMLHRIEKAGYEKQLSVRVKGRSKMSQYLYLFVDENTRIKQKFLEMPPFEKDTEFNFQI
jgi:hypothetical protein